MIIVDEGGLLTTIQDLGRVGWQKYGVTVGGAMDTLSHRIANILVGNEESEATLEMTLLGPSVTFHQPALIAICGGQFAATLNNEPLPQWQSVVAPAGSQLIMGRCKKGSRGYLAVAGGFDVPIIQKSKSTYLRAHLGGFDGRTLQEGDALKQGNLSPLNQRLLNKVTPSYQPWQAHFHFNRALSITSVVSIGAIAGEHFYCLSEKSKHRLQHQGLTIKPDSDRMGYRLKTPPLDCDIKETLSSDTVTFGTVQLPSPEEAIILMADRQTCGGYPKILQIAEIDLPLLAQCLPHVELSIELMNFEQAEKQLLLLEQKIAQLKTGILLHVSS